MKTITSKSNKNEFIKTLLAFIVNYFHYYMIFTELLYDDKNALYIDIYNYVKNNANQMNSKIKNSFNKKINIAKKTNTNVNTNSDIDTSNTSDKSDTSDTSYSIESINITNNIRTNKNKYDKYNKNIDIETISSSDTDNKPNNSISKVLYDKNTRKYKNQNITNTSDKLLNRMMSEAQYINDISTSGINKISHPYAEDHINKTHELGKRKNIKK